MGKTFHTTKIGNEFITTTESGGCCAGMTGGLGCGGLIGICILLYPFGWVYENFGGRGLVVVFLVILLGIVLFMYFKNIEEEDKGKSIDVEYDEILKFVCDNPNIEYSIEKGNFIAEVIDSNIYIMNGKRRKIYKNDNRKEVIKSTGSMYYKAIRNKYLETNNA